MMIRTNAAASSEKTARQIAPSPSTARRLFGPAGRLWLSADLNPGLAALRPGLQDCRPRPSGCPGLAAAPAQNADTNRDSGHPSLPQMLQSCFAPIRAIRLFFRAIRVPLLRLWPMVEETARGIAEVAPNHAKRRRKPHQSCRTGPYWTPWPQRAENPNSCYGKCFRQCQAFKTPPKQARATLPLRKWLKLRKMQRRRSMRRRQKMLGQMRMRTIKAGLMAWPVPLSASRPVVPCRPGTTWVACALSWAASACRFNTHETRCRP